MLQALKKRGTSVPLEGDVVRKLRGKAKESKRSREGRRNKPEEKMGRVIACRAPKQSAELREPSNQSLRVGEGLG